MISNYLNPQVSIAELLRETDNRTLDRLHAVVFGPCYDSASEDDNNTVVSDYSPSAQLQYRYIDAAGDTQTLPSSRTAEPGSVSLLAKDLRFALYSKSASAATDDSDDKFTVTGPYKDTLQYSNTDTANLILDTGNSVPAQSYDAGRVPQPGDIMLVTGGEGTVERTVVALKGKNIDAATGTQTYSGAAEKTTAESFVVNEKTTPAIANVVAGTPFFDDGLDYVTFMNPMFNTSGQLTANVRVTCETGGASPVFKAVINGVSLAVDATVSGTTTTLTILAGDYTKADTAAHPDPKIVVTTAGSDAAAWTSGDYFLVEAVNTYVDKSGQTLAPNDDAAFKAAYTVDTASKAVPSQIVMEVIGFDAANQFYTVRLYDTAGIATPQSVNWAVDDNPALASLSYDGVTISLTTPHPYAMHIGQTWALPVTPPSLSTTQYDRVVLNGPVSSVISSGDEAKTVAVSAYAVKSFIVPETEPVTGWANFTVESDHIQLNYIKTEISGYQSGIGSVKAADTAHGTVAPSWRSLQPVNAGEAVFPVDSEADIIEHCGSSYEKSELGFGLKRALSGSQGKRVYGLKTAGTSEQDFIDALKTLESAKNVYALSPLTTDENIMLLCADHAERMSKEYVKRFRKVYVGTDSPGEYPVLLKREDGSHYLATVTKGAGTDINIVTFEAGTVDLLDGSVHLSVGDTVKLPAANYTFTVKRIVNSETIETEESATQELTVATPVELWAADTPENTARYVWGVSERIGAGKEEDRRISNIWVDKGYYDDGTGVNDIKPNRFLACEIAGIRTALQPQVGLTRTEITTITDAPTMYTRFTRELLNDMAARGVWIVTQEEADGPVFIRHQITTAVDSGSLYYEDSVGVNIDAIAFSMDDLLEPFIGKRNVTPRTVVEVKNTLMDLFVGLTQSDYDSLVGPQIINFYNRAGQGGALDVTIDPDFKDRLRVYVLVEIALPLNNIMVVLEGTTIMEEGVPVTKITSINLAEAA